MKSHTCSIEDRSGDPANKVTCQHSVEYVALHQWCEICCVTVVPTAARTLPQVQYNSPQLYTKYSGRPEPGLLEAVPSLGHHPNNHVQWIHSAKSFFNIVERKAAFSLLYYTTSFKLGE
ncbi:hypothetical protein TNCV_2041121 [Trichonephila clavipes]|nr:hypothetical protein TNCV_2041121 [Trichonephila clavipes]